MRSLAVSITLSTGQRHSITCRPFLVKMRARVKSQEWPDFFDRFLANATDKKQVLAARERPRFGSCLHNSLGQCLTDAGQTCQFWPRYGIDFDKEDVGARGRSVAPVFQATPEVLKTNASCHHCPDCQKKVCDTLLIMLRPPCGAMTNRRFIMKGVTPPA